MFLNIIGCFMGFILMVSIRQPLSTAIGIIVIAVNGWAIASYIRTSTENQ